MPRTRHDEPDEYDDEPGDDYDGDDYDASRDYDPEDPETYPAGLYVDNERPLVPCPHCSAEIDEESEQCPKCGMYMSKEDSGPQQRQSQPSLWIAVLAMAVVAVLWFVIVR